MDFNYDPPPTIKNFHNSDSRVRVMRGPVGSAKTTGMIMELLRRAAQQEPQDDGIRRSRAVIVRNTLNQLKSTCLVSIQQLLRPITRFKVSESTIYIRMGDIETEWLLLPLDTEENIQRLLSLELTFAWVSECREIDPEIIMSVLSRCGRYPSPAVCQPTWYGLIAESNSFSVDSPWYSLLEEELPANWKYFVQPGAFDEGAENLENLPPSYYQDLMESNSDQWVEMYIHNRYGPSLSGQAVYRSSYNFEFHESADSLEPVPGYPLVLGMDFGREPAAVICQYDHRGRLLVMQEVHQKNMGVEKFVNEYVTPMLMTERFKGYSSYIVGDPSGVRKTEIGEESVFGMLKRLGYQCVPAQTNFIDPRLRAVEKFLLGQRDGGPALLVDKAGCPDLIAGFRHSYRYKVRKVDKALEEKPEKNHPWSDLHDALQYAALGSSAALRGYIMRPTHSEESVKRMPSAAWT